MSEGKRKVEEAETNLKKLKNIDDRQDYTTLDEWPVFNHLGGGMVKITPWGCIRKYTDEETGTVRTKFEDQLFEEVSFGTSRNEHIYQMPSTPQSMNQGGQQNNFSSVSMRNDPNSNDITLSSSDEVELYVINGYNGNHEWQTQHDRYQFLQEQENYLAMSDGDIESTSMT